MFKKKNFIFFIFLLLLAHCDQYAAPPLSSNTSTSSTPSTLTPSTSSGALPSLTQTSTPTVVTSPNITSNGGTISSGAQSTVTSPSPTPAPAPTTVSVNPNFASVYVLTNDLGDFLLTLDPQEGTNVGYTLQNNGQGLFPLAQNQVGSYTNPVWRCRTSTTQYRKIIWWHFLSLDPNCEGQTVDSPTPLGYSASAAVDSDSVNLMRFYKRTFGLYDAVNAHLTVPASNTALIQALLAQGFSNDNYSLGWTF